MDELLKNCNTELFKVGDKVRIRQDIRNLATLKKTDIDRYTRIFPNPSTIEYAAEKTSRYFIANEMGYYAGETATITGVMLKNNSAILSATYKQAPNQYSNRQYHHDHTAQPNVYAQQEYQTP